MKRSRFSVEQVVAMLKQAELGMAILDLIRKVGISEQTYCRWKKQYNGLQPDQARERKQLPEESARLKKLVAESSLDKAVLQDVAQKYVGRPSLREGAVDYMTNHWRISQRRDCQLIRQLCSSQYYRSRKDPRHDLLQRSAAGQAWTMDFVAGQFSGGAKFRILTVVDVFTSQAPAVEAGSRLRGEHVVEVLNRLVALLGAPKYVFVDNGSEFTGQLMDMWAYHHGVRLDFSRPGKPTDNSFVETFNGSLRDECLNMHWFATLSEARAVLEAWRNDHNESRPHSALKDQTPDECASKIKELGSA